MRIEPLCHRSRDSAKLLSVLVGMFFATSGGAQDLGFEKSADQIQPKVFSEHETSNMETLLSFVRSEEHPKIWLVWKYELGDELDLTERQADRLAEIKHRPVATIQLQDLRPKYGDNPYALSKQRFSVYLKELRSIAAEEKEYSEELVEDILTKEQSRRLSQIASQYSLMIRRNAKTALKEQDIILTNDDLNLVENALHKARREFRNFREKMRLLRRLEAITDALSASEAVGLCKDPFDFSSNRGSKVEEIERSYSDFSGASHPSKNSNSRNIRR